MSVSLLKKLKVFNLTCGSLLQEIMKANQLGSMLSMAKKRSMANLKVNIASLFWVNGRHWILFYQL